jgi:hypothetical protein
MSDEHSGAHLLRHLHNGAMPLEGRLRMLNAYYNRAKTLADLNTRAALVDETTVPVSFRVMAYQQHVLRFIEEGEGR